MYNHSPRLFCGSTFILLLTLLTNSCIFNSHAIRLQLNTNGNDLSNKVGGPSTNDKPPTTPPPTEPPPTPPPTEPPSDTTTEPPTEEQKRWHGTTADRNATRTKNWPPKKCPCLPKRGRIWPPPGFDDGGGGGKGGGTTTTTQSTGGEKKGLPLVPIIAASAGGGAAIILFGVGVWLMKRRRSHVVPIEEIRPLWSGQLDQFEEAEVEDKDEQRATFVQLERDFAG